MRIHLAIKVTSQLKPELREQVVAEVFTTTSELAKELTPRSLETLFHLSNEKRLITAFQDDQLIGWAVVEKLTKNVSELGMAYVKPKFRRKGVLHKMLDEASNRPEVLVLASYSPELIEYGVNRWEARRASLWEVALISRGRFITKRLKSRTRTTVNQHLSERKPLFAITDRRKRNG